MYNNSLSQANKKNANANLRDYNISIDFNNKYKLLFNKRIKIDAKS